MEKLKNDLYDAFYWYYRTEYATIADYIERENDIRIDKTDNAELYVQERIENLIHKLRG